MSAPGTRESARAKDKLPCRYSKVDLNNIMGWSSGIRAIEGAPIGVLPFLGFGLRPRAGLARLRAGWERCGEGGWLCWAAARYLRGRSRLRKSNTEALTYTTIFSAAKLGYTY